MPAPLELAPNHAGLVSGTPDNGALRRLVEALELACLAPAEALATRVRAALAAAIADNLWLNPAQRLGNECGYVRHLLAADPAGRFTVVALVWSPGQASPIHAHHTWCGYAVIDGTLTETLYQWQGQGAGASVARLQQRPVGTVSFAGAGRGDIHQLGNASAAPAISVHVYGVEAAQIATHVNDVLQIAA